MKRNMMRMLALVLALMTVLCACGGSENEVAGTVTPATEAAESKDVSMGRIEGGTYTNDYAGFTMTLGGDWVFYSAEELQDLPENIAELVKDTELGDAMDPVNQFTDVLAESVEELTTINVLYQKLDLTTRLAYAAMDEEAVLDGTLEQAEMMIEGYAQAGIIVENMEKVKVTYLGQERTALKTTSTANGIPYYILQIFETRLGAYSVTVTFASFMEDKTESLLELCSPIA